MHFHMVSACLRGTLCGFLRVYAHLGDTLYASLRGIWISGMHLYFYMVSTWIGNNLYAI